MVFFFCSQYSFFGLLATKKKKMYISCLGAYWFDLGSGRLAGWCHLNFFY